jgi:hypothetical protein
MDERDIADIYGSIFGRKLHAHATILPCAHLLACSFTSQAALTQSSSTAGKAAWALHKWHKRHA